jgi:hypothetical protein
LAEATGPLWINDFHTSAGLNDCVPVEYIGDINYSLKLIPVRGLHIHVFMHYNRRRVQADFSFSGVRYSLWVTDPVIEEQYRAQADGVYNLGATYLTISLTGPYLGRCYKLVAAIIGRHP